MQIRPIRTKADYKRALHEVSAYFDNEPEPGSEDGGCQDFCVRALP